MGISGRGLERLRHFSLAPVATRSTTFTGATTNVIDLRILEGDIQIILDSSAATATGIMTGQIQGSQDGSTNWAALVGGSFIAIAQIASKQVLTFSKNDISRYIRFVGTIVNPGTITYGVNGYGVAKYSGTNLAAIEGGAIPDEIPEEGIPKD